MEEGGSRGPCGDVTCPLPALQPSASWSSAPTTACTSTPAVLPGPAPSCLLPVGGVGWWICCGQARPLNLGETRDLLAAFTNRVAFSSPTGPPEAPKPSFPRKKRLVSELGLATASSSSVAGPPLPTPKYLLAPPRLKTRSEGSRLKSWSRDKATTKASRPCSRLTYAFYNIISPPGEISS